MLRTFKNYCWTLSLLWNTIWHATGEMFSSG